jgi:hypothetical protein
MLGKGQTPNCLDEIEISIVEAFPLEDGVGLSLDSEGREKTPSGK